MKRIIPAILIITLCAALLVGCARGGAAEVGFGPDGNWPSRITIVQMPDENNPHTAAQLHDAFRAGLQEHLGIEVEELLAFAFEVGLEALRAGNLDIILVTPMSFFQADMLTDGMIEPLVTWSAEGSAPYKTVFITRADRDDINSLEDLENRTFAFVNPASSSGFMYPMVHLVRELGRDADRLVESGYFFEAVAYSGSHDSSIMGVIMGDFDGAAVAYQLLGSLENAGLIDRSDLKIIAETELIPMPTFIIRSDLPQDLRDAILEFYLDFDDPEYFEALFGNPDMRFIRAYREDYDIIADMVRILNLEVN
ncbi:MAG: phosphate/phosphite/phosphonate ABC transporter substrate-binding protein [Oscillospiraceae bacterium]|nr:phosphate/phosphite/phosphonate ABC transporter substrate-binding protein [Oscillospiraceae bacterium]